MSLYGPDGFEQSACGWQRLGEDVVVYVRFGHPAPFNHE